MSTTTLSPQIPETRFGPLGHDVYRRTYSRPMSDGTLETWPDTVERVVRGNLDLVTENEQDWFESDALHQGMYKMEILPAGRHLWVTGVDGIPGEGRRNCWRAPFTTRLADHFEFTASMLLLGGGVGANYSREYLASAPEINSITFTVTCDPSHPDYEDVMVAAGPYWDHDVDTNFIVDDSREGWVEVYGALFDAATGSNNHLSIDVTNVRPRGAPILTFGGTASGPGPLVQSLANIAAILNNAAGFKMTGMQAMNCDHEIASSVVAGGARRSARMSIMHWNDPQIHQFIECKADHMHHWTTNISVEIDQDFFDALNGGHMQPGAEWVLENAARNMYMNGEPGFYNVALASVGEHSDVRATNPCGEVPLQQGESCNIGSVNLDALGIDSEGIEDAFRLLTRFLMRQTLTPMTNPLSSGIESENRRIGAGFLGLQGWAAAHGVKYSDMPKSDFVRASLRYWRSVCREEADMYAAELGIPKPLKVTAVAPNGTISLLPGTQPGASVILMRQGVRNVQYTDGDARLAEALTRDLPVEPSIYAANTSVVSYPMQDPLLDRFPAHLIEQSSEVSVEDQLAVLAMVTEEFCGGNDGNAVSYTASFDQESITEQELCDVLRKYIPITKGITCFPTKSRPQSPFIPTDRETYLALTDHGQSSQYGDTGDEELACSIGGGCPIR